MWPALLAGEGRRSHCEVVPDCAVPLAKRAIEDLTRLCQKAREAAQVMERIRIGYRFPVKLILSGYFP